MTTTPIIPNSTYSGYSSSSSGASGSSGSASGAGTTSNPSLNLSPTNFVKFLITQLQNQDPLNPTSSDAMLQEMSQIGQLQSSNSLETDLQGLTLQNQVGSASSLIGKEVTGTDANNSPVSGVVNGVQVNTNSVSLQLDNGSTLSLGNVSTIAAGTTTPGAATGN